jgi:hypothetical protein
MVSGRQKDKRNGWHTIQTSSSWFYMGRRGFLYKYTSKYFGSPGWIPVLDAGSAEGEGLVQQLS